MSATIRFIAGSRKGSVLTVVTDQPQSLGRDPDCDIPLEEGNVSRQHAQLSWDGQRLVIENLSATNGVFVNGMRKDRSELALWDVVAIGSAAFRIESLGAAAAATSPQPTDPAEAERLRTVLQCVLAIQHILGEDSERMVERSLETLFLALPATRLSLFTVDADGALHQGFTTTQETLESPQISHGFARKVLHAGKAILLSENDASTADGGATLQELHVRTILGAPVMLGRRTVAILLCDNTQSPEQLDERSVSIIEFAAQALATVFQRQEMRDLELRQARSEREFLAAKRVQKQIFTKDPAAISAYGTWEARYQPAYDLGGDFFDFYLDDDSLSWIVADVSGKGIPAALVVSMLKGFCKTLYPRHLSPMQFLLELNQLFQGELPGNMFFTGICVRITAEQLTWCNIGHPPGLLLHPDGHFDELEPSPGMLGLWPEALLLTPPQEFSLPFFPGDRLVLYTDGLVEAMNAEQSLFGLEGIKENLATYRDRAVHPALGALLMAVEQHVAGLPLDDDITLVMGER